jgi:hypothetical protein
MAAGNEGRVKCTTCNCHCNFHHKKMTNIITDVGDPLLDRRKLRRLLWRRLPVAVEALEVLEKQDVLTPNIWTKFVNMIKLQD